MANNVIFKFGTKAQYEALASKDASTLYWLTDVQELYKGTVLYGKGAEATNLASGLMSAADKAKLDSLSAVVVPEYSIERQAGGEGAAAKYRMKKVVNGETTYVGDEINIPAGLVIKSGTSGVVTEAGVPYEGAQVGDHYIDLVLNDTNSTHIYVPVSGVVASSVAGNGIKIENNVVSVKVDEANANGLSVSASGVAMGLATTEKAGAMSAVDKVALGTLQTDMTQVKADIEQLKTSGVAIVWESI